MADNYLEKRREEYEARKAEWLKKKKRLALRKKSQASPSQSTVGKGTEPTE